MRDTERSGAGPSGSDTERSGAGPSGSDTQRSGAGPSGSDTQRSGAGPSGSDTERSGAGPSDQRDLLRLATAGSVDDGKSTLVGRLLYDTRAVLADQLAHVEAVSARRRFSGGLDLALLTDGLRAEREQGITIDVAYRQFATPRRRFILPHCPGHPQYTRNMVTGASTADLALLLVDAEAGLTEQSRRHAAIAGLLRMRHVIVAVNKMDLVGFSEEAFDDVVRQVLELAAHFELHEIEFIPISALHGDNVVDRSERMPWYAGPPLLER